MLQSREEADKYKRYGAYWKNCLNGKCLFRDWYFNSFYIWPHKAVLFDIIRFMTNSM